jgi:hypothetical protein
LAAALVGALQILRNSGSSSKGSMELAVELSVDAGPRMMLTLRGVPGSMI